MCHFDRLAPGRNYSIVTNPDKPFGWNVHQKSANEFSAGNRERFPLAFVSVILDIISHFIAVDGEQSVIADRYAMGILPKILNNRVGTIECLLNV